MCEMHYLPEGVRVVLHFLDDLVHLRLDVRLHGGLHVVRVHGYRRKVCNGGLFAAGSGNCKLLNRRIMNNILRLDYG